MKTISITLTEADLDKALAAEWDTATCLLSQAAMRTLEKPVLLCPYGQVVINKFRLTPHAAIERKDLVKLQVAFDQTPRRPDLIPPLRAQLPKTFNFDCETYP